MLRRVAVVCLALLSPASGEAASQCLPKALFATSADPSPEARLRLGFAGGVATLCIPTNADRTEYERCFAVDAGTGALSASAATRLTGRSAPSAALASNGCVEGYCVTPKPAADSFALFAISSDEGRAVVLVADALHVFDAKTKAQTAVIPLTDEKAPADTNFGLSPDAILYLGRTLYVVGGAAGPFKAVWLYGDDGRRLGSVQDLQPPPPGQDVSLLSVYPGAANTIDDKHVAFADAALQTMQIYDEAGKKVDTIKRAVTAAPCTADDMLGVSIGDLDNVSAGCKAHAKKDFQPFFDVEPVRLPSGDLLTALSGAYLGQLTVLDGKTLTEKRRIELKRCDR